MSFRICRRLAVAALVAAGAAPAATAQSTAVTGTVFDAETAEPLPGATLTVAALGVGTAADSLGRLPLPPGARRATAGGCRRRPSPRRRPAEGPRRRVVGIVASGLTVEGPVVPRLLPGRASFIVSARRTYIDVLARPFLAGRTQGQSLTAYFYDLSARVSADAGPADRIDASAYLGNDIYESGYERTSATGGVEARERFGGGAR